MASIILDSTSSNLTCGDQVSLQCNFSSTFANSWLNGNAVTNDNPGPVTLTFFGTSVAFYASGVSQKTANTTIFVDGQQTVQLLSSFQDPWFSTDTLLDGQHNVTFESLADGFIIDYMVISASNNTSLLGKQLIVDDTDPSFVYTGRWTDNTTTLSISSDSDIFDPDPLSVYHATSFGGSFKETQDQQASVQITFIGTSISVYGFLDIEFPVVATFSIDGANQLSNFPLSGLATPLQANYPWFQSRSNISPGSHVLTITFDNTFGAPVVGTGGRFTLDYITYTPSFSSLATQGETTHSTDKRPILIDSLVGAIVGVLLITSIIFLLWRRYKAKKASTTARLAPNPYQNAPGDTTNTAAPPGAQPHYPTIPISTPMRKNTVARMSTQRGPDVVQVSPPNQSTALDVLGPAAINSPTPGPPNTNANNVFEPPPAYSDFDR